MTCVILYRINGGPVEIVWKTSSAGAHEDLIYEFGHLDEAVAFAERNRLFQSGQADYQIVELDELLIQNAAYYGPGDGNA